MIQQLKFIRSTPYLHATICHLEYVVIGICIQGPPRNQSITAPLPTFALWSEFPSTIVQNVRTGGSEDAL